MICYKKQNKHAVSGNLPREKEPSRAKQKMPLKESFRHGYPMQKARPGGPESGCVRTGMNAGYMKL